MNLVIALIPARSGSKGVPHKNIRPLGGHALLEWSIRACLLAKTVDRTIVSTDSEEYAELARSFGAEAPFLRPAEISTDKSSDLEFVLHALEWLRDNDTEPQFIVHIRPTTPLRDPHLIDDAVQTFMRAPQATAIRSVQEMSESAYKTFEIAPGGQLKRVGADTTSLDAANNARQSFPPTYYPNGYVDVLSTDFIRRSGLLHGDHVLPYVTPPVKEVDTEDDFHQIEYELSRSPKILQRLFEKSD